MIFVTVGTQLPFDRLVRGVDVWAGRNPDIEVRGQVGYPGAGGYRPRHMVATPTLDPATFRELFQSARLVIAHAGTGSLLQANASGRQILIMPRKAALGEHRTDHQVATVEHFADRSGVNIVYEEQEIGPAIDRLLAGHEEPPVLRPSADPDLITALRTVIFPEG